jgi:hypothetical protein
VAEGKPAIVAPLHFNSAGILYEQENPLIALNATWQGVVPSLRDALQRFSFRDANLRDHLLTDWPSYKASGLRTVRQFQSDYHVVQIAAVNEAELFFHASSQPRDEKDVTLNVTLNPYSTDEEIARLLGRLFDACLRWPTAIAEGLDSE